MMSSAKNGKERRGYVFPWLGWIRDHKKMLIADTLISFLSCIELTNPSYHFKQSVVRRLIPQEYSAVWNQALKILKKDVENSIDIVCAALKNPDNHAALKKVKCVVIDGEGSLPDEIIDMWNAVSFLIGSSEEGEALLQSLSYKTEPAFYLRDMAGLGKYGEQQIISLSPEQIEKLISALIPSFSEREEIVYGVVVTHRTRKDDGAQLISRLISIMAADTSTKASLCLDRLATVYNESAWGIIYVRHVIAS